jgi:hypothetical protein
MSQLIRSTINGALPALLLLAACEQSPFEQASFEQSAPAASVAPASVTATAMSASRMDVAWQDDAKKVNGYEIHRSDTGPAGSYLLVATVGARARSYSDRGLAGATQYCYIVRSYQSGKGRNVGVQYSPFSAAACAVTFPPPGGEPPVAPSDVHAQPDGGSFLITWRDESTNESGFRIEYTTDDGASWTTVGTAGAGTWPHRSFWEFWDWNALPIEQFRCYRVVAFNNGGEAASARACTVLPAPATNLVMAWLEDGSVQLTWHDDSDMEDGYDVEFSHGEEFYVIAELPANSTSYRDSRSFDGLWLVAYQIRSRRDGGRGLLSNQVWDYLP